METKETSKPNMPGHEKRKVTIDLLKHIGTVSIALIVYMNYFKTSSAVSLVPSILSSFVCLITSIISAFILLAKIDDFPDFLGTKTYNFLRLLLIVCIATFIFSVTYLVYATLK
jgi:hypothetical protein